MSICNSLGFLVDTLALMKVWCHIFGTIVPKCSFGASPSDLGIYKVWSLCTDDGYPLKLISYTGADPTNINKDPLGARVVLNLIELVVDNGKVELYFDNFFTSTDLLS